MADATATIRALWPDTVMLGKTISERLPKAVIEIVMTLVRAHPEVFSINGINEEILPAAGVLQPPAGWEGRRRGGGEGGGRREGKERGGGKGREGREERR